MKKCISMITLFFAVHLCAQEIPLPQRCFPLNGTNAEDIMSGQAADIHGIVHAFTDRFGAKGKAISFDKEDSYLSFPLLPGEQERKELTLTYWLYVSQDSITQAFWTKDHDGNLLLGMGRKGVRAMLNIYHTDNQKNILPDQQWMWDDSNFYEGEGWYFVTITYADDGTHFYLFTPKGKMTECYSAFTPDWNLLTSMCIGSVDGIPAAEMDDFKIYDVTLSSEQVSILYQSESQLSMGSESLINVETGIPLCSSTWYFHCVGFQKTLQYALQKQSDLSFISADVGYDLLVMSHVESDYQKWFLNPLKDILEGRVFTISNIATGMNLTGTHESVFQQVMDDTDSQKWCVGQIDTNNQMKTYMKEDNSMRPLYEEIYFDKSIQAIRIYISFPKVENVKIRLIGIQGTLLCEFVFLGGTALDKKINIQTSGVYLVTVESDFYKINKKIIINF